MKIAIPTVDYPPIEGGISSLTLHVSRELASAGHDVTVIAPYFPGLEAFDAGEPINVIRYRGYGLGWLRFVPLGMRAWGDLRKADLILGVNVAYGGVLGLMARRTYGKPYVAFAYAYEFLKFSPHSMWGRLIRRAYNGATTVVAISQFTRDKLVECGIEEQRVRVIHPGAAPAVDRPEEELRALRRRYVLDGKRVILAVGRLIERKGHRTLIAAMPRILESAPNAHLVVVGQGPMMSACSRQARELGIRDHVTFTGRLDDAEVSGLYRICDVFALPTGEGEGGQVEGFGLVFAEAHAYAKPVVAGRSGGVVDAVVDGETGLLVEPDAPDALADAVTAILQDESLANRLGENGRKRVESERSWTAFAGSLLAAIEERA